MIRNEKILLFKEVVSQSEIRGFDMRLKIDALICLALAIIAGCVWVLGPGQVPESPLPAGAGSGEEKYSLTAEFPEVRDSYTLYRVVPVAITEEQVREVAERFGLAGEPGTMNKKTGEFLIIDASKDPEEQVSVYAHSGAVAYHILDLELPTEVTRQPDLPMDAEAEKIALAFLEKTGMQSPDARVVEVGVNQKQEVWKAGESEPEVSYDVTKAVRFGRSLGGLPGMRAAMDTFLIEDRYRDRGSFPCGCPSRAAASRAGRSTR